MKVTGRNPEFSDELNGFIALSQSNLIFVDIGSHYGVFTLAALRYGAAETRVWAVDPSSKCHRVLTRNVRLAGGTDRVQIIHAAIGETDGELTMLSTGANSYDFFVASSPDRPDALRVPQYRLETLAKRIPSKVTHLKIDVEGHEWEIINGSCDYLQKTTPLLFLELHSDKLRSRGKSPEDLLRLLNKLGYVRFEHRGKPIEIVDAVRYPVTRLICFPTDAQVVSTVGENTSETPQ